MTALGKSSVEVPGAKIRQATPDDTLDCHRIMWHAITDLASRHGMPMEGTADDWWTSSEPQFRYLARSAAEWWVAEVPGSGSLLGYARSIERGGHFELTEGSGPLLRRGHGCPFPDPDAGRCALG